MQTCANCGAPLLIEGSGAVEKCPYCGVETREAAAAPAAGVVMDTAKREALENDIKKRLAELTQKEPEDEKLDPEVHLGDLFTGPALRAAALWVFGILAVLLTVGLVVHLAGCEGAQ